MTSCPLAACFWMSNQLCFNFSLKVRGSFFFLAAGAGTGGFLCGLWLLPRLLLRLWWSRLFWCLSRDLDLLCRDPRDLMCFLSLDGRPTFRLLSLDRDLFLSCDLDLFLSRDLGLFLSEDLRLLFRSLLRLRDLCFNSKESLGLTTMYSKTQSYSIFWSQSVQTQWSKYFPDWPFYSNSVFPLTLNVLRQLKLIIRKEKIFSYIGNIDYLQWLFPILNRIWHIFSLA